MNSCRFVADEKLGAIYEKGPSSFDHPFGHQTEKCETEK